MRSHCRGARRTQHDLPSAARSALGLFNAVLQPMPAEVTHGSGQFPLDYFFRSLAADQKDNEIGIVLSGTRTDGTLGVQALKGVGGVVAEPAWGSRW